MASDHSCRSYLRWAVFATNFFFWISGLGILGVALWLYFDPAIVDYMHLNDKMGDFYTTVYIMLFVGFVLTFFGFFGCLGAWRLSECLLVTFFLLLILLFCLELTCAILAYIHQDQMKRFIDDSMHDTVYRHYAQSQEYTDIFDRIQITLECCGVSGYRDWLSSYYSTSGRTELGIGSSDFGRVPQSCCNDEGKLNYPVDCGETFDKLQLDTYRAFLHTKGCRDALYDKMYENLTIVIGICIFIGALQLFGMALSMLLCCLINSDKGDDKADGYI